MTNEQRAHDIAISMLNRVLDMKIQSSAQEAAKNGSTTGISIDPYTEYKEIYSMILPLVQRDFPNDNH